ncbi:MAG: GNAT family protein [Vagococcus sp.]
MRMKTSRIYVRPLQVADASYILKSSKDQEIRYMTGTTAHFSLDVIEQHIQAITKDDSREDYAICLNETDEVIGELSILDIDEDDESAGFRISMTSIEHTGKGLGYEALRLMISYVFEELKLNRLQLEVFSHNKRGIRAYEKVGFVKEGTLRQTRKYEDHFFDEVIMSILKQDYVNRQ